MSGQMVPAGSDRVLASGNLSSIASPTPLQLK